MTNDTEVDQRARHRAEDEKTLRDQARMALGGEEDATRAILRDLRGELAGIRTRLDSLVGIQKELGYQGQRLTAIEKRLATLVETKLNPDPVAAVSPKDLARIRG